MGGVFRGSRVIGIVMVTHFQLAEEFLRAVQLIVGELDAVRAIGLDPAMSSDEMRLQIDKTIGEVQGDQGTLVLVDMFGGTPSNLCLAFLEEGLVEVVTGLNLPMLVKAVRSRGRAEGVQELARIARDAGRRNISVASDVLAGSDLEDDA